MLQVEDKEARDWYEKEAAEQTWSGVLVMETSGLTGDSLQQIKSYLQKTKTVAFIGSSGVGKSTLINRLLGEECLKTNTLRKDDKGRHTTTHRELFLMDSIKKGKFNVYCVI